MRRRVRGRQLVGIALLGLAALALLVALGCGARQWAGNGASGGATEQAQPKPGTVLQRELVASVPPEEIDQISRRFYVYENALPAQYAVDWYRIRFVSTDQTEASQQVAAQLFVPRSDQVQELPIYAFGPGTTGLSDACAASHEQPAGRNWGDFQAHLLSYATRGYVGVMPDYPVSGDPQHVQLYYIAEAHARVMLDVARAALRFFEEVPAASQGTASPAAAGSGQPPASKTRAANAVFFAGYSQGGHAAYAARDAASRYAPELKLKGAIGYGPRGDVATLPKEVPYLGPYLFYSYARVYGPEKVPLDKLLLPRWQQTLERDVLNKCIDEVPNYYGSNLRGVVQPAVAEAMEQNRLDQVLPQLKQVLESNRVGQVKSDVPVLILQALEDTIVELPTQEAFVRKLCGQGAMVTFTRYGSVPHTLIRQVSYRDTLAWMETILKGGAPRVDCAGRT